MMALFLHDVYVSAGSRRGDMLSAVGAFAAISVLSSARPAVSALVHALSAFLQRSAAICREIDLHSASFYADAESRTVHPVN